MTFATIPAGTSVFLDTNVFVYSFTNDPSFGPASTDLLERIEFKEVLGFISSQVFSEIAHRLMTLEACQSFGWSYTGIGRRLRRHPPEIQKLQEFRKTLDDIVAIGIQILPVHYQDVILAGDLSCQHGLLSSDALIIAKMQTNGLTHLASSDADFERIPGITRYAPV